MEFIDIHNQKPTYERILQRIEALPNSKNKEIIKQYIAWHQHQIDQKKLAYSSAIRSLRHALNLCVYFYPDITTVTQKQVEEWFSYEIEKEKVHKTSTGSLKPTGTKRSVETMEDYSTQGIKFFKFVKFISKGKPLLLFNSKKMSLPEQFEFISVDTSERQTYEKPRVTQEEIQKLIEFNWTKKSHVPHMVGCMTALFNDTGMRFSEGTTLRLKDISSQGEYSVISIQQSKTRTRTVPVILCQPYLTAWIGQHPQKDNPNALLFYSNKFEVDSKGKKVKSKEISMVDYDSCRTVFNDSIKELGISWKEKSAFHYLRHLFASRATVYPDFFLKYQLGWHDRSMRAHYSQNTYKECLGYYKQMIQQERNPMLNKKLSFLDKQQRTEEDLMIEKIRTIVLQEMKNKKD